LRLLRLALYVRPEFILVSSGVIGWTFPALLRLTGAKLVPILHNTLWPEGYPPSGPVAALRHWGNVFFWRCCVWQTLAVSPAAGRQADSVAGPHLRPTIIFQPSFPVDNFKNTPNPKDFNARPFRVMFAGRIEENKGVLDLVTVARSLHQKAKDRYEFAICGDGPILDLVNQQIADFGVKNVVKTYGRLNRPDLVARYLDAHIVIVPTRTSFEEGYAMVVAEALLLLRPVITCSVVPAAEVLKEAVVLAKPNEAQSYVEAIEAISKDEIRYLEMVEQARRLRPLILDSSKSFLAALSALKLLRGAEAV